MYPNKTLWLILLLFLEFDPGLDLYDKTYASLSSKCDDKSCLADNDSLIRLDRNNGIEPRDESEFFTFLSDKNKLGEFIVSLLLSKLSVFFFTISVFAEFLCFLKIYSDKNI